MKLLEILIFVNWTNDWTKLDQSKTNKGVWILGLPVLPMGGLVEKTEGFMDEDKINIQMCDYCRFYKGIKQNSFGVGA